MRYTENATVTLVELLIRILTVSPGSEVGMTLFTHGSPAPALLLGSGVNVTCRDARGRNVLVGAGVSVTVAVGGGGVAVGMAAWVSAIIVKATAAAEA